MLSHFQGSDKFMDGIGGYLKKHSFGSATTQDLWSALGGEDIVTMMNSWVLQPGYPVLNVSVESNTDFDAEHIVLRVQQQRMMKLGPSLFTDSDFGEDYALRYDADLVSTQKEQLWEIPIEIEGVDVDEKGMEPLHQGTVLKLRSETISLNRSQNVDFDECYLLKHGPQTGFVRVLYSEELMAMITGCWLSGHLSDFDKFWIISDRSAFMASGYLSAMDFLQFLAVIVPLEGEEPSYLIWDEIIGSLMSMDSTFCSKHNADADGVRTKFRKFCRELLSATWSVIGGWNVAESDTENVINLRSLLIYSLVRFEDTAVIRDGANLWNATLRENDHEIPVNADGAIEGIDSNLLRYVMECALTEDGSNVLYALKSVYPDLNSEHQSAVLRAIGAVYTDSDLVDDALNWVLSSGSVRDQDKLRALYSLRRCYGREQTWNYLVADGEWDNLFAIYGSGFSAQDLTEIADAFASKTWYNSIHQFFWTESDGIPSRRTSANERSVNQSLENIQVRSEWMNRNWNEIRNYMLSLDDGENEEKKAVMNILNVIWMSLLALLLVLCCCVGMRWIWKRNKNGTSKRFRYRRQIDEGDRAMMDEERASKLQSVNVNMRMESIDDAGNHIDDGGL